MSIYSIFMVSDSLNQRVVESIAFQVVSQFSDFSCELIKIPNVTSQEKVIDVVNTASQTPRSLIVFSTTSKMIRDTFSKLSSDLDVICIDALYPTLKALSGLLESKPNNSRGHLSSILDLNKDYFNKIAAMEFAINNDDGKSYKALEKADIILLGVSRTSKTPLSVYLAYHNYFVMNIPLFKGVKIPKELYSIPARKIIGLTISSTRINEIRVTRDSNMGVRGSSNYSDMNHIIEELSFADQLMKKIGCKIINVSDKAIEETAEIIISQIERRTYPLTKTIV